MPYSITFRYHEQHLSGVSGLVSRRVVAQLCLCRQSHLSTERFGGYRQKFPVYIFLIYDKTVPEWPKDRWYHSF